MSKFTGQFKARQSINGSWYVDDANRKVVKTGLSESEAKKLEAKGVKP